MNSYLNFSDSEADKREQREQEMGLNVDSSKVKNSINYGSLLNYSSNAKDNYLNRIKKKIITLGILKVRLKIFIRKKKSRIKFVEK